MQLEDGTFQNEKSGEKFEKLKQVIRLSFKASNGDTTISCVCFTKVAAKILHLEPSDFTSLTEIDQRKKVKEILYETKLLTMKNQPEDFLLLNVEDFNSYQQE